MSDGDQRLLERFVRLCEIPSPTGSERAVADAVLAELRELGVEVVEDEAAAAGPGGRRQPDRAGPGSGGRLGDVLRPPRHGPRDGADRGRARRRRLSQPRRDDPRRRRQGGGRGPGRARSAPRRPVRPRPGSSSCSRSPRRTGCVERGARSRRAAVAVRVRPRSCVADRRADHGDAEPPAPGRRVRGGRGARRDPARGRAFGDRGGGGGGRCDEPRPARPARRPPTSA